ncbi:MAG: gamma carbonic anhydrase family protein [Phycisphaerales bacterium]|nr:gamma carbonic anhydrase family protein [Phycisphaerales bacterium]
MIREIDGRFIADTARVIGQVTLGRGVSILYAAVIRGDVAPITIGDETNVQDHVMIHADTDEPNVIGKRVSIGHGAVVHGREVGDGSLIGIHATVLNGVRIGKRCIIAAGAVVPPNMVIPDDSMVMGIPGRVVRETTDKEREYLSHVWRHYVEHGAAAAHNPDGAWFRPWNGPAGTGDCHAQP